MSCTQQHFVIHFVCLLTIQSITPTTRLPGFCSSNQVRVENLDPKRYHFDYTACSASVTSFYASEKSKVKEFSEQEQVAVIAGQAQLSRGAIVCLGTLIEYLKDFGLASILKLTGNFRKFEGLAQMHLDGLTLGNLEVLRTEDDEDKGSLIWLLRHTRTAPGHRLLKQWISQPLLDRTKIEERLEAVTEIATCSRPWVDSVAELLSSMPDLERGLSRAQYKKCLPLEFYTMLSAFNRISKYLPTPNVIETEIRGHMLKEIFSMMDLPEVQSNVQFFLESLKKEEVDKKGNKADLYTDPSMFPDILSHKNAVHDTEAALKKHIRDIRKQLGPGYANLEYKTVNAIEYLVEVKTKDITSIPGDWTKVNQTKACARFHPPQVLESLDELNRHRESLEMAAEEAWQSFLQQFCDKYALFRTVIRQLSVIDCLFSLATTAKLPGYCKPSFADHPKICVKGARHPMAEAVRNESFVPNDMDLCHDGLCILSCHRISL